MTDNFDPSALFKSNFPKNYVSDRRYMPPITKEKRKNLQKAWEGDDERKKQASDTAREVLHRPEAIVKREEILSEVRNTEEWRTAQQQGAKRNAQENMDWYESTVARCIANAKDPEKQEKKRQTRKKKLEQDPSYLDNVIANNRKLRAKQVTTPKGNFDSMRLAAEAEGVSENTLRRYITNGKPGYSKEQKNTNYKTTGKKIHTPYGIFESQWAAGAYLQTNGIMCNAVKKIQKFLKTDPNNYYYIEEKK